MRTILPHEENPILRSKAESLPIADIPTPRIQKLIADMKALLAQEEHGVALAAPQVGEPLRLFIVAGRALSRGRRSASDEASSDESQPEETPQSDQVYINPEFVKVSRHKSDKHEGCLSIRGKWGIVPRAEKATLRAYDEHGQEVVRGTSGFLAHIFQHEMDHLDGVLYVDKAKELYEEKASEEEK